MVHHDAGLLGRNMSSVSWLSFIGTCSSFLEHELLWYLLDGPGDDVDASTFGRSMILGGGYLYWSRGQTDFEMAQHKCNQSE